MIPNLLRTLLQTHVLQLPEKLTLFAGHNGKFSGYFIHWLLNVCLYLCGGGDFIKEMSSYTQQNERLPRLKL